MNIPSPTDRAPLTLWVLVRPSYVFHAAAQRGTGYGLLFAWLALELVLAHTGLVASALVTAIDSPGAGLRLLAAHYSRFVIGPAVAIFVAGIALHYQQRPRRKLDLWAAASVITYAWVPHLAVVAVGVLLERSVGPHWLLPQVGYEGLGLSDLEKAQKWVLEYGASVALAVLAFTSLSRPYEATLVTRHERWRAWGAALVLGGLLAAAASTATLDVRENWAAFRPVRAGERLPTLHVHGLDGTELDTSTLLGRVVLVDFWATWCPPCVRTLPELEQLHRELGARGLTVLSINVEADAAREVREFAAKKGLSFPVYLDRGAAQAAMQVTTLPTLFVVDKSGRVRDTYVGEPSATGLRKQLEALLAE